MRLLRHSGETGRLVESNQHPWRVHRALAMDRPWPRSGTSDPDFPQGSWCPLRPRRSGQSRHPLPGAASARQSGNDDEQAVRRQRHPHARIPRVRLGVEYRLQQRTKSGWVTRDVSRYARCGKTLAHLSIARATELSTSFSNVGRHAMRVLKPAAMCRAGHCRVAAGHSKRFSVVSGNRVYFVERRLNALGVPVGKVDGVVDARAQQAFCAWRDMTGATPNRRGVTKSLVRSVMHRSKLPAPRRTNGIYVNEDVVQILFQVKNFRPDCLGLHGCRRVRHPQRDRSHLSQGQRVEREHAVPRCLHARPDVLLAWPAGDSPARFGQQRFRRALPGKPWLRSCCARRFAHSLTSRRTAPR